MGCRRARWSSGCGFGFSALTGIGPKRPILKRRYDTTLDRPPLRDANARAEPGVLRDRDPDPRARNRREHSDLQHGRWRAAAAAGLPRAGAPVRCRGTDEPAGERVTLSRMEEAVA